MNKKNIIFGSLVLLFSIGFLCYGIISLEDAKKAVNNVMPRLPSDTTISNILTVSSNDEEHVLPTAKVQIKQYYKKCGHTTINEFSVPEDIVNMNKIQLQKYYFGWNINNFSSNKIVISKECSGICDEHYIVRDEDGLVNVYNIDDENNEELVYATEINTKYLPKEDWEKLQKGINIVGKENLSILLEDYEQ